jgi:predicted membrane protein DUF2231
VHSRARVLGQAVNPVLMLLPLGILASAVLADLGALTSGLSVFATLAHADMVPGLLAGILALCALFVDLITAPPGTMARRVLGVVCALYSASMATFALVWSVRAGDDGVGNGGLFVVEVFAIASGVTAARLARGLSLGRDLPRFGGRLSRLAHAALSRLAHAALSRIPHAALSRIPVAALSRIPHAALSRIPVSALSRIPRR